MGCIGNSWDVAVLYILIWRKVSKAPLLWLTLLGVHLSHWPLLRMASVPIGDVHVGNFYTPISLLYIECIREKNPDRMVDGSHLADRKFILSDIAMHYLNLDTFFFFPSWSLLNLKSYPMQKLWGYSMWPWCWYGILRMQVARGS